MSLERPLYVEAPPLIKEYEDCETIEDLKLCFSGIKTKNTTYALTSFPKYVGYYTIHEGFDIHFYTKPKWIYRYFTRILLGWIWKDAT